MPAGLGAAGWLAICFETVMGTYLPPTTAGTVWVPIISETLAYNEAAYYSPQIRQQTVFSDRTQGYYSVQGDIVLEFDPNTMPYFLHTGRHNIAKSGAGPYTYGYSPSQAGSSSTAASGNVQRTASITVVRNGVGFGYAGMCLDRIQHTLNNGVLEFTLGMYGLSEADASGSLNTPAWLAPDLFGAAAHSVYLDAAGLTPAFAAANTIFNTFNVDINFNAAAQNRINALRSASYISYGMTDAQITTELDFLTRTDYDNFKNNARHAVKFESLKGGATFALATEAYNVIFYNTAFDTYQMNLGGLANLIMASATTRGLVQVGGNPYLMQVKTPVNIT